MNALLAVALTIVAGISGGVMLAWVCEWLLRGWRRAR